MAAVGDLRCLGASSVGEDPSARLRTVGRGVAAIAPEPRVFGNHPDATRLPCECDGRCAMMARIETVGAAGGVRAKTGADMWN